MISVGRLQEDEEKRKRERRIGVGRARESALKRVIRSRGRYQVQTSFGAYRRAARTRRVSAICKWRYVLSIRMYVRVRARARATCY